MSTILNALRRLEEDRSPGTTTSTDPLPEIDGRATDALRDRILAEEYAGQAGVRSQRDSNRAKRKAMVSGAVLLVMGLAVGAYMMSTPVDSDRATGVVPMPETTPLLVVAAPERFDEPENLTRSIAVEIPSEVDLPESVTKSRPVETPAEAVAENVSPPSRPKPTNAEITPPAVSAPQPRLVPTTKWAASESRPEAPIVTSEEEFSAKAPSSNQVERLERRSLPDLTVVRTAWHPDADRRSAKIRLEATNEILTLREGDAVGGLVVQAISPSAVLFMAGDVEIRRRVGQPGSGG